MLDRNRDKIIAFDISINSEKIENVVFRRLLNSIIYDNDSNYKLKNKINIIASDGNWNYHKQVKCNYRKIVKVLENKTNNNEISNNEEINNKKRINNKKYKKRKLLKDSNGNIIKIIKEKYYNNFNKDTINQNSLYDNYINNMNYINYNFIDCNIHIIDKAEIRSPSYASLLAITNLLLGKV